MGDGLEPDAGRVILHFDVDCMYAQAEELRDPALRGRPLAVTQKYLVVTCNYAARAHGVTKLMAVAEARRCCPHLALVSGEDLTPYRAASKRIMAVLQRYGTAEKLGLDEIFVDVTPEVQRRLAALARNGAGLPPWQGHVHAGGTQLVQESRHRPMDLRAAPPAGELPAPPAPPAAASGTGAAGWEPLLRVGSAVAAEARAAVRAEAGFRTSAGIACNKLLAKLCSGIHKPDDQTVLPPPEAAAFVAPLPLRALPGVGHKMETMLAAAGLATAADARAQPRHALVQLLGERLGAFLHAACRGKDASPVVASGPPKAVTVEDSFRSCRGFAAAEKVVAVLAPDLLARIEEEQQENARRPATLTAKWRHAGQGSERSGGSCAMPAAALAARTPREQRVAALVAAARALLRRHLREPFDLSLINLGAAGFSDRPAGGATAGSRSIAELLAGEPPRLPADAAAAGAEGAQQGVPAAPPALEWAKGAAGRAAAAASQQQRRSYSAACSPVPLLSKRDERRLREVRGPGQATAHRQQHGTPGSLRQQQHRQQHDRGWGEDEEEEDEGYWAEGQASEWDALEAVAAWRGDGERQRSPSTALASPGRLLADGASPGEPSAAAQPVSPTHSAPKQPAPAAGQQPRHPQRAPAAPKPTRTPAGAKPASYRNAEALAVQRLFGGSGGGAAPPAAGADADERASLELALRLQQEEVRAAAAPRTRCAALPAAAGGRPVKQRRAGGGPMDAFLSRQST